MGYDAAFMEACRAPLTVDPEAIAKRHFYVLDEGGMITGFYGLSGQTPRGEIEFLFVEPGGVRSGHGQKLARHFLALARSLGFEEMDVSADPSAEGFYVAMGAMRIAEVPSDAIPNRLIPRLRFSLLTDRVTASSVRFALLAGEKRRSALTKRRLSSQSQERC